MFQILNPILRVYEYINKNMEGGLTYTHYYI